MPDENNPAVESSTQATAVLEVPSNPDSTEYADWRLTGKIPAAPKPKPEDPAPSTYTVKSEKAAPVSETGISQQEPRHSKAERRLTELLEDLKRAGLSPSELKTFKREAQKTAEAARPPEQTVKPADEAPKRPKYEDFKTLEEYQAAEDKYHEDATEYRIQKALKEDRARQAQEAGQREMRERLQKAKERYGEGADTRIIQTAKDIFNNGDVNPAVKAVLNDSDVLVDVMYVMGSKAEDLAEFLEEAKTAPGKAIRRAVLLERLVKEELAKSIKEPARKASEEPEEEEEPPPAKKVTKATAPPREASGNASTPPDVVQSAVSANDARRYFAEQNRRDLQRRRTG
jgi:hypothetical protein